MNSDIRIFISTHRDDVNFPKSKLLFPIQVGTKAEKCFDGILHDNEGVNIAEKNPFYCELTAQYYVYKNIEADYYGFFHYRRYFNFSSTMYPEVMKPFLYGDVLSKDNSEQNLEKYGIDDERMRKVIEGYDYIIPTIIDTPDGATVYEQYRDSTDHYIHDLDTVLDIIKADYPEIWPYAVEYCKGYRSYVCNMFIMKKDIFKEYSSFLFDVLEKHERISDFSDYSPVAKRVSGYLGERLCGIYITYLKSTSYKGKELQRVFFEEFRKKEAITEEKTDKKKEEILVEPDDRVKSSYFDENYEEWFEKHKVNSEELEQQRNTRFEIEPMYSIIVPLYNTPIHFFDDMVNSVLKQSYQKFELLLVNASPCNEGLLKHVKEVEQKNSCVKQIVLEDNYGITENTNYGIKEATGDFLCFFDHDDVLEPDALYEYTRALNENPTIDMFYCDEDKLLDSRYCYPFFKPDWNIDYLNAVNYVCHFLTVRKSILDNMELPTSEYDGSQDYHMTYRIGEKSRSICHIPKVLYHWRIHEQSTAGAATQKDYTLDSSVLSIEKHIERCGIDARVEESRICPRRFSIRYGMPKELVSIVIFYQGDLVKINRCIQSLKRYVKTTNFEIIVVGKDDRELSNLIDRFKRGNLNVEYISVEENFYDNAIKKANGQYFVFVDSNTEFVEGTWEQLVGTCIRDDVIACAPRVLKDKDTIDNVGISLTEKGVIKNAHNLSIRDGASLDRFLCSMDVEAICGKCFATKKEVLEKIGGLSEDFSVFLKGVDFSLKAKEEYPGLNLVVDPTIEVVDLCPEIENSVDNEKLLEKWNKLYSIKESSYNPNLDRFAVYDIIQY